VPLSRRDRDPRNEPERKLLFTYPRNYLSESSLLINMLTEIDDKEIILTTNFGLKKEQK